MAATTSSIPSSIPDRPFLSRAENPLDLTSARDFELCTRIYTLLVSDETIRTGLDIDSNSIFIKDMIIPRLLVIRRRILETVDDRPDLTHSISSKHDWLQFDFYGKASIRVKNGKTYIGLPHIRPCTGAMKIVKYMIAISRDESNISLEMMSKIRKEQKPGTPYRTPELCRKFIATANVLQTFQHPNILTTTDILIPNPKKGYELITPKCEMDLYDFLQTRQKTSIEKQTKDCIRFMQEITSAMKYVYDRGYLHCDVKPENILLKREPDGTLKTMLMDFDLLTKYDNPSEFLRGTPDYIPPSYLSSLREGKNDISTELYALGKILHDNTKKLVSFTRRLSRLQKKAAAASTLSTAINKLIEDIIALSDRLTHDEISSYTTVLNKLDQAAIQFETALICAEP